MDNLMPCTLKGLGKPMHRYKKSGYFLHMMLNVALLLVKFCD